MVYFKKFRLKFYQFFIKRSHHSFFFFGLMILFWAIFDSIISYITPIVLNNKGISQTEIGLIISISSIAAMFFDLFIGRYFKKLNFKVFYLLMFLSCFIYPIILLKSKTLLLYIFVMILWGFYYTLYQFGLFDVIFLKTTKTKYVHSFSLLSFFKSLGYFVGPFLIGLLIIEITNFNLLPVVWSILFISLIFFIFFLLFEKKEQKKIVQEPKEQSKNFLSEFVLWFKIAKFIIPVLIFTALINCVDAFFWTIGPIFSEKIAKINPIGNFFVSFYMLPPIIIFLFIEPITKIFGKKKTSYFSLLLSSVLFLSFGLIKSPFLLIIIVFFSSVLNAIAWPTINGVYADYISEAEAFEKEIIGLEDFFANLGYIIGPIFAGLFADYLDEQKAFSLIGFINIIVILFLIKITPKKINIKIS